MSIVLYERQRADSYVLIQVYRPGRHGRIVIDPRDFMITWVQGYFKKKCPADFEVTWSVKPMFLDTYKAPVLDDRSRIMKITLAQGLKNTTHTLEVIPNGDGNVPIREIQVHRPPLR